MISLAIAAMVSAFIVDEEGLQNRTAPEYTWRTRKLVEKVNAALETYRLLFPDYPPETKGDLRGSAALHYYLTKAFRTHPDVAKDEVKADRDAGPFVELQPQELRTINGVTEIVDRWGTPLHYSRSPAKDDPSKPGLPVLYSCGPDCRDEARRGDDISAVEAKSR